MKSYKGMPVGCSTSNLRSDRGRSADPARRSKPSVSYEQHCGPQVGGLGTDAAIPGRAPQSPRRRLGGKPVDEPCGYRDRPSLKVRADAAIFTTTATDSIEPTELR